MTIQQSSRNGTLASNRRARGTTRSLELPQGLAFDDWVRAGQGVSSMVTASAWWLGDWIVYGERAYGQRYRTALEATPFEYKTLRNYAWVARRFDVSRRRDSLSFQHHAEVASLPEPAQELWLQRAETHGWSRNELRRQLTSAQLPERQRERSRALALRVDVADQRMQRWRDAAMATGQDLTEWLMAVADEAADATLI
jgi:hypothetical protein